MDPHGRSKDGTGRVVSLGATCDLVMVTDDGRTKRFSVGEFAELDDGRRVVLHSERRFTVGWRGLDPGDAIGVGGVCEDLAVLEGNVLNVVLPDEDDGADHPWAWLARLAQARGLNVGVEDLRRLPYRVEFTSAVVALAVEHPGDTL